MTSLITILRSLREARLQLMRPQPGQTNVEYAFILFLVGIATVVLLTALAGNTTTLLSSVNTTIGS
jgi:Flp pilus assembly pilin Flp